MFNTWYTVYLLDHKLLDQGGPYLQTWTFGFRSKRRRYIIYVELYKCHIYVIKYYAACHAESPNKYNLLLKDEQPAPIIRTCINVMLQFYRIDPLASFGFIGSNSINKGCRGKVIEEGKTNTQRFRIYKTLMFNFWGKEIFEHVRNAECSAYFLINKANEDVKKFMKGAVEMFSSLYLDFELALLD